jgi:hypothetical protein
MMSCVKNKHNLQAGRQDKCKVISIAFALSIFGEEGRTRA